MVSIKILAFLLVFRCAHSADERSNVQQCMRNRMQNNENTIKSSLPSNVNQDMENNMTLFMSFQDIETINNTMFNRFERSKMTELNLSANRISMIESGSFQGFTNLRVLSLENNSLWKINETTFGKMEMLEEMILSSNMISLIERGAFDAMPNLKTFDISMNCMFKMPGFIFFRNLKLKNIYLNENYLTSMSQILPNMQYVENFNMSGNYFTNMTTIVNYYRVESLDMSNNPLSMMELNQLINGISNNITKDNIDSQENSSTSDSDETDLNINYVSGIKYSSNTATATSRPTKPLRRSDIDILRGLSPNKPDRMNIIPNIDYIENSRSRRFNNSFIKKSSDEDSSPNSSPNSTPNPNPTINYLINTFKPSTMSEEKLEKTMSNAMMRNDGKFNAVTLVEVLARINNYYKSEDSKTFLRAMMKYEFNRSFSVEQFVSFIKSIMPQSPPSRGPRDIEMLKWPYSSEIKLNQIYNEASVNHLNYFTCQNCSLDNLDFLLKFPELQYIDVTNNNIRSLNVQKLSSLQHMRYMLLSDNKLTTINFDLLIQKWADLRLLNLNNNRISCTMANDINYKVLHMNRLMKFEFNKC
ncbi:unnamed protein product [Diamesa serratosioi]